MFSQKFSRIFLNLLGQKKGIVGHAFASTTTTVRVMIYNIDQIAQSEVSEFLDSHSQCFNNFQDTNFQISTTPFYFRVLPHCRYQNRMRKQITRKLC